MTYFIEMIEIHDETNNLTKTESICLFNFMASIDVVIVRANNVRKIQNKYRSNLN